MFIIQLNQFTLCAFEFVKKSKSNPRFLRELLEHRERMEIDKEMVKSVLLEISRSDIFVDSIKFVQKKIQEIKNVTFKKNFIQKVMKRELKMKYKKMHPVAFTANSVRNLILRQ